MRIHYAFGRPTEIEDCLGGLGGGKEQRAQIGNNYVTYGEICIYLGFSIELQLCVDDRLCCAER
jgi:hypothetical protein